MNIGGIKRETRQSLPQFCLACFSDNRTLTPVGQLTEVFYSLFESRNSNLVFDGKVSLCWECRAVLQRVAEFKCQVNAVQNFIYNYCNRQCPLPSPLTKLSTAHITSEIYIEHDPDYKYEVKAQAEAGDTIKKTEIKEEDPQLTSLNETFKEELEDNDTFNDSDWRQDGTSCTATTRTKPKNWRRLQKRPKPAQYKYIKHTEDKLCLERFVATYKVGHDELLELLEKDRRDELFLEYPHRCMSCVQSWRQGIGLALHNKTRHSKREGTLQCDICRKELSGKKRLRAHIAGHYVARRCNMCGYESTTPIGMRRHVLSRHFKPVECRTCGACFRSTREFFTHYKELHRKFICDHCGRSCSSRDQIKKHLTRHGPFTCCGQTLKSLRSLHAHRKLKHELAPPELCYCVECDLQFKTVLALTKHFSCSAAHGKRKTRGKNISCPDCGKVYARKSYMLNHYNYVHVNRSNYRCDECDMSFLNRTHLVRHQRSKHEPGWQAPKNKICDVCGRGFAERVVLTKHMRTHTGERPYHCTLCDSKFTQSTALKTHVKHIHLKESRKPVRQISAKSSQKASYLIQSTAEGNLPSYYDDSDRDSRD